MFFLFLSSLSAKEHGKSNDGEAESKSSKKSGSSISQAHSVQEPYIQIGPLTISVIKDLDIRGYIRFAVNLLVEKKEDYDYVKGMVPRLENQYNIDISTILSNYWVKGSEIKLDNLKNIVQMITDKVVEGRRVKAVFIDSYFYAHPPEFLKPLIGNKDDNKIQKQSKSKKNSKSP